MSELVAVTELVDGDVVDLEGDPFADRGHGEPDHECAHEFEQALVGGEDGPGALESPDCYRLDCA